MGRNSRFIIWILLLVTSLTSFGQDIPDSLTTDLFDQKEVDYYSSNPILFNQSKPSNLHYRVKVGSFSKEISSGFFKNYYPVTAIIVNNSYRYYIGLFTTYNNAELARGILVEEGFKGAFLVAFKGDKEISLSKAIEMESTFIVRSPRSFKDPSHNVKVVMTELPPVERKSIPVLDSSKLKDNLYYLDYFYYEFVNSIPVDGINTEAEEIMPIIWPEENNMSFVRAFSEENSGGLESGHDIWMARKDSLGYKTTTAFGTVNTKYNDAIVGVSNDGNRVYLLNKYVDNGVKRGLSIIELSSGQWSSPKAVPIPDLPFTNNFYGFYVHPDEDLILLSMEAKDSYGMNDIYIIEKNELGNWGEVFHLDSTINTDGNDISPFITKDKRIFIYSTDGMGGLGMNDLIIFKRLDSTWTSWSEAQNVGIEVNTEKFEAYPFIVNNKLFYSSVRDSSLADIYRADIVNKMVRPIEEYLEMKDSLLFTYNVEAGVLSTNTDEDVDLNSIPVLAMVNTDSRIDMIFFDYDRYNLKPNFIRFLNELENILEDNPDINLGLRGHTDSIGSLAYNYILGENRAASVKDYMISIGVSPSRIDVESFGKEIPIASNETALGRAKNRRVEIRFIRKDD